MWKQSREKKVSGEKKEDVLWEHPPFDFIIVYIVVPLKSKRVL